MNRSWNNYKCGSSAIFEVNDLYSGKILTFEDKKPNWSFNKNPRHQETFLARNEINYKDLRRELAQKWEV